LDYTEDRSWYNCQKPTNPKNVEGRLMILKINPDCSLDDDIDYFEVNIQT
jgi:hypothetical protein